MSKHTESQEGQSNRLGEEHPPDSCRHFGEGISNTTYNKILEKSSLLHERCSKFVKDEESLI
jgi:hypothetical protein